MMAQSRHRAALGTNNDSKATSCFDIWLQPSARRNSKHLSLANTTHSLITYGSKGGSNWRGHSQTNPGGAYVIRADNLEEAKALAFGDPVHTTKSSVVTVYEWNAK